MGDQKSNRAEAGNPKERRQWGELVQNEKTFRGAIVAMTKG